MASSVGYTDSAAAFVKAWDNSPLAKLPLAAVGSVMGAMIGASRGKGFLGTIGNFSLGAGAGFVAAKVVGFGVDYLFRSKNPAATRHELVVAQQELGDVSRMCTEVSKKLGCSPGVQRMDVASQIRVFGREIELTAVAVDRLIAGLGKTAAVGDMTLAEKVKYLEKYVPGWLVVGNPADRAEVDKKDNKIRELELQNGTLTRALANQVEHNAVLQSQLQSAMRMPSSS